ncbi:hypothetical protein [Pseudomonas sp. NPDC087639]|uniref:hypothetical protein n=1 Tax=Pseudomonas sp. NPDC087639 TaxID=3364445 RepID=UPI00382E1423
MADKMTDEKQLKHLKKTYENLDANKDGVLTFEEFAKGTKGYAKSLRELVWKEYNKDGDNDLTLDEYLDNENAKPAE